MQRMIILCIFLLACNATPVSYEFCVTDPSGNIECKIHARFRNLEECEVFHKKASWACDTEMTPPSRKGSIGTFSCEVISEEWDSRNGLPGWSYRGHCRL